MLGVMELKRNFERFVKKVDYLKEYKDNPIYSSIRMESLIGKLEDEGRGEEADLFQKILDEVSSLKRENSENEYEFYHRVSGIYEVKMDLLKGIDKNLLANFEKKLNEYISIQRMECKKNVVKFRMLNTPPIEKQYIRYFVDKSAKECNVRYHKIEIDKIS